MLMKQKKDNLSTDRSYGTKCSTKGKPKIAKPVEDKCTLQCEISNNNISIFMDTGAQVPIIEQESLHKKFPSMTINSMEP